MQTKGQGDKDNKNSKNIDENGNENHLNATEPRWFAVRTRFRDEKVALKMLTQNGIETYLPIKKLARRYGKKVRYVDMPLINSYIFVKILKDQHATVLQTEYTTGFLKFGKNLLSIPERQIGLMRRLLGEDVALEYDLEVEETVNLTKGDSVEVISGPLMGMKGHLLQINGKERMVVELDNSGFSLTINMDKSLVQKI